MLSISYELFIDTARTIGHINHILTAGQIQSLLGRLYKHHVSISLYGKVASNKSKISTDSLSIQPLHVNKINLTKVFPCLTPSATKPDSMYFLLQIGAGKYI